MNRSGAGFVLLEVVAAASIITLLALSLSVGLIAAMEMNAVARAVTQGRLMAQSHLAQAAAGVAPPQWEEDGLVSTLQPIEQGGLTLWQVEVQGDKLPQPLRMVGGP